MMTKRMDTQVNDELAKKVPQTNEEDLKEFEKDPNRNEIFMQYGKILN